MLPEFDLACVTWFAKKKDGRTGNCLTVETDSQDSSRGLCAGN